MLHFRNFVQVLLLWKKPNKTYKFTQDELYKFRRLDFSFNLKSENKQNSAAKKIFYTDLGSSFLGLKLIQVHDKCIWQQRLSAGIEILLISWSLFRNR